MQKELFDEYRGLSDSKVRPDEKKADKFLAAMKVLLSKENNWPFLRHYKLSLEACTHCGICAEACPVYLGSGRKEIYSPVNRSDLLRRVYKKHFTATGKLLGPLVGARTITEEGVNAMAEAAYRCTICRRCAIVCPFGLDNGLITRELRKILSEIGIVPDELKDYGVEYELAYGNSPKIPYDGFANILRFAKDEIDGKRKGANSEIPVDKVGAKYLVMNNAGDYLSFLDTVEGIVEVMNYVGVDWTLNSPRTGINDVVNYGLFYSDRDLLRVFEGHIETVKKLKPEYLVGGECGHAYDSLGHIMKDLVKPEDRPFKVTSVVQLFDKFLAEGRLKLDREKNPEPVTFHDSCKLGRASGIYEEPRRLIRASCKEFREMNPNRQYSLCCGGGGGFALMNKANFPKFKMETYGRLKSKQVNETGASVLVTICSNCKRQFQDMVKYYKMDVRVSGLSEIIANALVY